MIIYLPAPVFLASCEQLDGQKNWGWTGLHFHFGRARRYPRITPERFGVRAGCPPSVLSCTTWGFSCLPNYFVSGELLPRLFTLACAFLKEPAVSFL